MNWIIREIIKQYLKEKLKLYVSTEYTEAGNQKIIVELFIDDESIDRSDGIVFQ